MDDAAVLDRIGFYLLIALIGVALLGLRIYLRSRLVPSRPVKVSAVPQLFERLKARARELAYISLVLPPQPGARQSTLNIQFSILNGLIGLDWVVADGESVDREAEFSTLAKSLGHTVRESSVAGLRSLRVEDGDLPALCRRVLVDIARLPGDGELRFMQKGLAPAQS